MLPDLIAKSGLGENAFIVLEVPGDEMRTSFGVGGARTSKVYMVKVLGGWLHLRYPEERDIMGRDKNSLMASRKDERRKAKIAKKQAIMRRR